MVWFGGRQAGAQAPEPRMVSARATVLQVGKSVTQHERDTAVVKVRLRVEMPEHEPYECTVPWEIPLGQLGGLAQGRTFPVRVAPQEPGQVHPAAGGMTFSTLYQHWVR